jgi:hypothetical protein
VATGILLPPRLPFEKDSLTHFGSDPAIGLVQQAVTNVN